jgi:cation transporter-like permease
MLKKMPWLDRIGILAALIGVGVLTFFFMIGKVAIMALFAAFVVVLVFAFILMFAANRRDDNPDNDTLTAVASDLKAEAASGWSVMVKSVKGDGDAK